MNGVCTRWAVVYDHDSMPIEGTLYTHKAKANKRRAGLQNPDKFRVAEVAVMPLEVARRLIAGASNGTHP
jgi:hypothetical protein